MKVSLNWVRQYTDVDVPVDELVRTIGAQLGEVEDVTELGPKYRGAVIVKVVSCEDHPNADRLHVCKIDDGGVTPDVPRDANGHVQVVCGAPNVEKNVTVVWLPPGSTVPESHDKDPFVLEARELRGVVSNGMLASPKELLLGESHEGLLLLESDKVPGTPFAEAYQLDDYVIDIENKMFTHRPDLFGELGVAREIAGITGKRFTSPDWYTSLNEGPRNPFPHDELALEVRNELPELVPRFMAVAMRGVEVKTSPAWLQTALVRVGIRPINNVVDITNYMMMLTGQPLHAYDYDKVKVASIGDTPVLSVRNPHVDERLTLLNGKKIDPRQDAIMIATDKELIGVGGVMGGADTEVDANTTNIILEVATFDMYSVRRTSMAHGLFTDAVTRFNKGQSPLQNPYVLAESMRLLKEVAYAEQASSVIDNNHVEGRQWVHPPVPVNAKFINARLGFELSADDMKTLLENVEFQVSVDDDTLMVTAPFWRTDIETREDVVEEVGRLYGFDKLPLELPQRSAAPVTKDTVLEMKSQVRDTLNRAGANEVLTYSFVHGALLDKVGQDRKKAYQIGNALSPDLQYYRLSLTPSLVDKVHANIKAGYDQFALFELGKAHVHGEHDFDEPDVPKEVHSLSLVYAAKKSSSGSAYYGARAYLDMLLVSFGATELLSYESLEGADLQQSPWLEQMTAPYEPTRSAVLRAGDGHICGMVGEFKRTVRRNLKLPDYCAGFEIDPMLFIGRQATLSYQPLPRFPKAMQDLTLEVSVDTKFAELHNTLLSALQTARPENTFARLDPTAVYQSTEDAAHKRLTFRLTIASYDKTMTDAEVATITEVLAESAKGPYDATRI